jgi:hypothetical protein
MTDARVEATPVVKDVHTEHCCVKHGCKYHWTKNLTNPCTVESGQKPQSSMCEYCYEWLEENWDLVLLLDAQFEAGRASVAALVLNHVQGLPGHPWIPGGVFKRTSLLEKLQKWAGLDE